MKAVVVGGGIAGLSAAHALLAEDFEVVVLEQARELVEIGAGINMAPNATRVLRRFGVLEALQRHGVVPEATTYRRWSDGAIIARRRIGRDVEQVMGAPFFQMHRADLQRVLLESLPGGVVRLGAPVVSVEQDDDEVLAALESGEQVAGQVLIAADGIRSRIRALLFDDQDARYSGFAVYRSVLSRRDDLAGVEVPEFSNWLGPDKHLVHYWVRRGELLNIVGVVKAPPSEDSWLAEAKSGELVAEFAGWDDHLLKILRCAKVVLRRGVYYREPLERWAVGRVGFMGDSAHAMTPFIGQGAAQAILDAAVLGMTLAGAASGDVPAALESYANRRRASAVDTHQRSAAESVRFHLPDGPQADARNAEMRALAGRDPYLGLGPVWAEDVYQPGAHPTA
jgi:salicylate hydroxylase